MGLDEVGAAGGVKTRDVRRDFSRDLMRRCASGEEELEIRSFNADICANGRTDGESTVSWLFSVDWSMERASWTVNGLERLIFVCFTLSREAAAEELAVDRGDEDALANGLVNSCVVQKESAFASKDSSRSLSFSTIEVP